MVHISAINESLSLVIRDYVGLWPPHTEIPWQYIHYRDPFLLSLHYMHLFALVLFGVMLYSLECENGCIFKKNEMMLRKICWVHVFEKDKKVELLICGFTFSWRHFSDIWKKQFMKETQSLLIFVHMMNIKRPCLVNLLGWNKDNSDKTIWKNQLVVSQDIEPF